jgi:uncharacterized protein YcfJ
MNPKTLCAVTAIATLAGCATVPVGPSVAVMPAPNKPFEVFQADNALCKDYARQQLGVEPGAVTQEQVASGAVAGALIGATAGAVLGGGHSDAVAAGAGMGALAGTAAGAGQADYSRMSLQRRYDISYQQCMYAKGNQVPGYPMPRYLPPPRPR